MVQVFIKHQHQKRGRWSSSRVVLSVDASAGSITVPGAATKPITVAFEDVRIAVVEDNLAQAVIESIDEITDQIEHEINKIIIEDDEEAPDTSASQNNNNEQADIELTQDEPIVSSSSTPNTTGSSTDDELVDVPTLRRVPTVTENMDQLEASTDPVSSALEVGANIAVYCPLDDQYYPGTVQCYNSDGRHTIVYADEDV